MPDKTKTPEKRSYRRDKPVSLRPLDFESALAGLLRVKPLSSPSPAATESPRPEEPLPPAKPRGKG